MGYFTIGPSIFPANVLQLPAKPIVGVLFAIINVITTLVFLVTMVVSAVFAIIDWKKGHPNKQVTPTNDSSRGASVIMNPDEYHHPHISSTPDPFLQQQHGIDLPTTVPGERNFSHIFSEGDGGRASTATFESRDMTTMMPTEPNVSTTNFNGGGNGVIVSPHIGMEDTVGYPLGHVATNRSNQAPLGDYSGYPLQPAATNHSNQVPLGVVMIGGGGRSEDGRSTYADSVRSARSRDGTPRFPTSSNQHLPNPSAPFRRQDSHLSQRSMNSVHSQRSFSRPGPVQPVPGLYQRTNPSQVSVNRQPQQASVEPGVAM